MVVYKKYIDPIFNDKKQLEKSLIQIQNIDCNILLLSGKEDLVWPASRMAALLESKIDTSAYKHTFTHIPYEGCGHQFTWFNEEPPKEKVAYQSTNLTGIKKHKFCVEALRMRQLRR